MNNIKAAVNDNDTGITAVESDITTIESDITTIEGNITTIDGRVSALEALTTGSISIAPQAFTPDDDHGLCNWRASGSKGYFKSGAGGTGCDAVAGIQLPDGATPTGITCYFQDDLVIEYVPGRLISTVMATGVSTATYPTPATTQSFGNIQPFSVKCQANFLIS